ncbi:MAG TPA: sigma-70 family RNA polymerase sigma factor [Thermoanaerobaculia bacterium]|nr:sigma-70 family RNA polymerase sigma factor [Thermoanaerobaculia bacterium]
MSVDDQSLIDRYLSGEPGTFAEVDDWIRRAAASFRSRLESDFDDVLQDVRLELTRLFGRRTFRGESSLKTYVWRVTANACLDRLRARRRVSWEELESVDQRGEALNEAAAQSFQSRETRDLLLRVLVEMSEDCRRLWEMIFDGLSYREMSARLGVAEGALRVRVLRCRRRALAVRGDLAAIGSTAGGNASPPTPPKVVGRRGTDELP